MIFSGVVIIFLVLFGGIKANDYYQVSKLVKSSDSLLQQGKYQNAYNDLSLTQTHWTTVKVKKTIETKMSLDKQLIADQSNYNQGNDLFGQSKWQDAKDSFSKVSNTYPQYKDVQDKIKQCQDKIDEANTQAEKDKQAEAQKAKQLSTPVAKPVVTDTLSSQPTNSNTTDQTGKNYSGCVQWSTDIYNSALAKATSQLNKCGDFKKVPSILNSCIKDNEDEMTTLSSLYNAQLSACAAQYPH